jgi:protein-tyrosine phosphatase
MSKKRKTEEEICTPKFRETYMFLPAFQYRNLQFFGGRKEDVSIESKFDLLINLTGIQYNFSVPTFDDVLFGHLFREIESLKKTQQLVLRWEDYEIPDLPPSIWTALAKDLDAFSSRNANKTLHVAIFCQGGTGRTGTALAILRNLLLKEKCDPVDIIRKTYKVTAVETSSQIEYVEYVTGVDSKCTASKTYVTAYKQTSLPSSTGSKTSVCTHTVSIPGCKGGCVEYYAKYPNNAIKAPTTTNEAAKAEGIVAKHYGKEGVVVSTPDCPACKLGTPGLLHTLECNKSYFEKSGVCGECYEDVSKNSHNHKSACSKHPDNVDEFVSVSIAEAIENGDYETVDEGPQDTDWIEVLVERFKDKTKEEIEKCEGCSDGEYEAAFHTKECNEAYFKGKNVVPY